MKEMKELVEKLNMYRNAYYNESKSLISDFEYDQMFDRLKKMEEETGIVMSNSPTISVGYEVKSELNKVKHNHPMLSLDKTKSVGDLIKFAGDKDCVLMCKMDGLTISLKYIDGELSAAETRGNGTIGEDVLHNVKTFKNVPLKIRTDKKEIVIDGEAIITYDDFDIINESLPEEEKYKNPRNLASGSVRQLDSNIAAKRNLQFVAWRFVEGSEKDNFFERLMEMDNLGFTVVPRTLVPVYSDPVECIRNDISNLKKIAEEHGYPIDGMVFGYNDVTYGDSLGATGHHLRSQIAFKFYDEEVETVLRKIEWGMGKHGTFTPVAVFDPVEIDGTTVERASLHNVSIMKDLELSCGDTITVYKANQIIPQVSDNLDRSLNALCVPPEKCPICGEKTQIVKDNNTQVLFCTNPDCKGKLLGKLCAFVSRDAHDIRGLSEATLQLLIETNYILSACDLFYLKDCKDLISMLPGLGAKSINKICDEIEKCRHTTISKFLIGLSIPLIGRTQSRAIEKYFHGNFNDFMDAWSCGYEFDWTQVEDFGRARCSSMAKFFFENEKLINELVHEFIFENSDQQAEEGNKVFDSKSICITGKLHIYKNRDELVAAIEKHGGKVVSGVTKKTDYLLTNDTTSGSSKNKKAAELGIPVITEDDFVNLINLKE